MAGDWIPIDTTLCRKLEVLQIARATGRSRHEVAGLLMDFWSWAQNETVDCLLERLTLEALSCVIGADEAFWRAVQDAGWIEVGDDGVRLPRAERWLSCGAKARLRKALRQKKWRQSRANVDAPVDGSASTGASTGASTTEEKRREEKRREEEKKKSPASPAQAAKPPPPSRSEAIRRIENAWKAIEGLPAIRAWSEARRKKLGARLRDPAWLEQAIEAIRRIAGSPFLCGENDRQWRANIDFLLRPESVTKILEGQYDRSAGKRRAQRPLPKIRDVLKGGSGDDASGIR